MRMGDGGQNIVRVSHTAGDEGCCEGNRWSRLLEVLLSFVDLMGWGMGASLLSRFDADAGWWGARSSQRCTHTAGDEGCCEGNRWSRLLEVLLSLLDFDGMGGGGWGMGASLLSRFDADGLWGARNSQRVSHTVGDEGCCQGNRWSRLLEVLLSFVDLMGWGMGASLLSRFDADAGWWGARSSQRVPRTAGDEGCCEGNRWSRLLDVLLSLLYLMGWGMGASLLSRFDADG